MYRKLLSFGLMLALTHLVVFAEPAVALSEEQLEAKAAKWRQKMERAKGRYIAVEFEDGSRAEGRLSEVSAQEFTLTRLEADPQPQSFSYADVRKGKRVRKDAYRTEGRPDPILVRQAVEELGVGEHVMVRRGDGITRGHIHAVDAETFTVRQDKTHQQVPFRYDEVLQVHENDATAFVIIGLALGFLFGWLIAKDKL
jgi:ribosome maturation factor RimP